MELTDSETRSLEKREAA